MIRVTQAKFFVKELVARIPFEYGVARLENVPHLVLAAEVETKEGSFWGYAADTLPPKWFEKDPSQSYEDEILRMTYSAKRAASKARMILAETPFDLWWELYQDQLHWAREVGIPPLLAGFGVSFLERAIIQAFLTSSRQNFHRALIDGAFGVDLARIHSEFEDETVADFLSSSPARSIMIRHTIGLSDPLDRDDTYFEANARDGLPVNLMENIEHYGLRYFKAKLSGDADRDAQRIERIAMILSSLCGDDFHFTLDGNEQFESVDAFRDSYEALLSKNSLRDFFRHLLFVEQPLGRGTSLSEDTGRALARWKTSPPIIIDEADGDLESLPRALAIGYSGVSHKNCKGIFKGLANACFLRMQSTTNPALRLVLSGEDLVNVGPVALPQDLTVLGSLGVSHAERNGHHYFHGLSAYSPSFQRQVLMHHGDVYAATRSPGRDSEVATLRICEGALQIGSIVDGLFGLSLEPPTREMIPLEEWDAGNFLAWAEHSREVPENPAE